MTSQPRYVLGSDPAEITRLDAQAAMTAPATRAILRSAGIAERMRVLDLGSGLGHVAFEVAALVGEEGAVVGIDQSAALLEIAERRRLDERLGNVTFHEADVRTYREDEPFDAVVGRLILFHLPDAVDVLAHHLAGLRHDGIIVAIDFDLGAARAEPPVPLVTTLVGWVIEAFARAGAAPTIGTRLSLLLREAGAVDVAGMGLQSYVAPDDPQGPLLLAGIVNTLAPKIAAEGIAGAEEIGLDTLRERIAGELAAADAVMLPPAVAGAWGRRR
jgi:SAM-dependent methyltransferase